MSLEGFSRGTLGGPLSGGSLGGSSEASSEGSRGGSSERFFSLSRIFSKKKEKAVIVIIYDSYSLVREYAPRFSLF